MADFSHTLVSMRTPNKPSNYLLSFYVDNAPRDASVAILANGNEMMSIADGKMGDVSMAYIIRDTLPETLIQVVSNYPLQKFDFLAREIN